MTLHPDDTHRQDPVSLAPEPEEEGKYYQPAFIGLIQ